MSRITHTVAGTEYIDYTDTDTATRGRALPLEPWEGDSTGLVHVLWSLRNDGIIAERPSRRAPLLRALYARTFGRDRHASDTLIADLRAILDEFDPAHTPGAIGARYLTPDEEVDLPAESGPRDPGVPCDVAANVIMGSRWRQANVTHAQARALTEAARDEEERGNPEVAERLRVRAFELTGTVAPMEADRTTGQRT